MEGHEITIPLPVQGVTSYFPTMKPNSKEFPSRIQIDLTYQASTWDPILTPSNNKKMP